MRYSRETSAPVTEVMERARQRFGPSGLGLRQVSFELQAAAFAGDSGTIEVAIRPVRPGVNAVEVASQAFDAEAARFVRDLPAVTMLSQVRRLMRSKMRPRVRP